MFANGKLKISGFAILATVGFMFADKAVAQQILLEVRGPGPEDDYLTWAPAPARIKQLPGSGAADERVVLTNDAERPKPPNRKAPLDGNLAFDGSVAPGTTATKTTLELVLPKDGSWVNFVVAGSRASSEDKDAVIEVRDGSAAGPVLHSHAVMVRIRKDHRELTDKERSRFLNALATLHRKQNRYEWFVHRIREELRRPYQQAAQLLLA
jgi:hypothetical protein